MNVRDVLGALLNRRDWAYSLGLLVPFVAYDLALKVHSIASLPGETGLAPTLGLMRSDLLFALGYTLLWVGLFAATRGGARKRLLRPGVILAFHATTMLVAAVGALAHQYFLQTGATLNYGIVAFWLPRFEEIQPILARVVSLSTLMLLSGVLLYATLGPWLMARAVEGWRERSGRSGVRASLSLAPLGLSLLALGFGSLSLVGDPAPAGASTSLARDPFVNVVLTGVEGATAGRGEEAGTVAVENPVAGEAKLSQTPRTERRNVVLVHLESARERSVTPYNGDLATTPFLDELAQDSLLAERAYTTVPHTSKASVSVNCGILPHLVPEITEAEPGGIPARCLADLLGEQGYDTAFFQSPTEDFEDRRGLVNNFGYEDFYAQEDMDTEDYEETSYFGYEDDIMLEPSEEWLRERGEGPFLAQYLTGTGHHDYRCRSTGYGWEDFSENDWTDRYLNCMRLQDIFVENLIEQYKDLGLYENTVFVFYGDHGEGMGEHARYQHNDTVWEEGIRVPLLIHAPGRFEGGERVEGPTNLTDVLPTVLDLLGYEVTDGAYPGYSLLRPIPEDRTLRFNCFHEGQCMASIKGHEKYVYHYENWPEELFDLSEDPLEENNLAEDAPGEAGERRQELFAWRSQVNETYRAEPDSDDRATGTEE